VRLLGLVAAAVLTAASPPALAQPRLSPSAEAAELVSLPERATIAPKTDCAALARRDFSKADGARFRILSTLVEVARPGRAEFCLVKGEIEPKVRFELRLPQQGYTGRYLQGGCGGMCGVIPQSVTPTCSNRHAFSGAFAVAFEDSGHQSTGIFEGGWAQGSPEAREDFAHRAAHVTAVAAKHLIAAYYGAPPAKSYFQGCSGGGREALMEAQRYPDDFDGVVVGSSVSMPAVMIRFLWEARHGLTADGKEIMTPAGAALLHRDVMAACDALDGLKDGQIDDPRICRYDPERLICAEEREPPHCLTFAQVEMARRFYQGPVDAQGKALFPGGEAYGAELTWTGPGSLPANAHGAAEAFFKYVLFPGQLPESFTYRDWTFDLAGFQRVWAAGAFLDPRSADLSAFQARGGKMILWQGMADNAAGMHGMTDYYQSLQDEMGGLDKLRGFARLFLAPGVYHCAGGYIPYEQDFLGAVVAWVERGEAPDKVMSTAVMEGGKVRRRPVFAYPARAKYRGGDVDEASSFERFEPPVPPNDRYPWAGRGS
jgi:hypothetical protein